jgi:protoporphyrinogen/coproporphyrinogen III oxidase
VSPARHLAIVGGGITGLAAAQAAVRAGWRVTLLEGDHRTGGKLKLGQVAGIGVDLGAESILARRPEGTDLAAEVGLGPDLVHPATTSARIWSRGVLRPLPAGQLMGVPGDLAALEASGVLSAEALARARADESMPPTPVEGDVAVGEYVAARLGREVVDRLVEPLLGGVYAGRADRLSLLATVPQLAGAAAEGAALSGAVRTMLAAGAARGPAGPVFAGIRGGIGRLPAAVAADAAAAGATVRTGTPVSALARTTAGWRLHLGDRSVLDADAVLLAIPAFEAARLLSPLAPGAAADLGAIDYASVALVTFAFPRATLDPGALPGSGFLVPPVDGRTIKAATFSGAKWPWVAEAAGDLVVLRASLGRHGETADLDRDDADLVKAALSDLGDAVGLNAAPADTHVQRWTRSLPQYAVGHLDRVARLRAALPPGIAVAGAAYTGLGIPACIASARTAVASLAAAAPPATPTGHPASRKEGHEES